MESNIETTDRAPGWMRDKLDWLLILAVACLLPLVLVFGADFWFRTDYRFFPILILATLVVTLWLGRTGREKLENLSQLRWQFGLGMWIVGGLLGLGAVLWFSPWLAMASLSMVWMAWSLLRIRQVPWVRVISWSLPMASVLLLPVSDATDPMFGFTASVTGASSNVLDLLGIPQMPILGSLEMRSGRLDVSALCRGLGNPYLLGALVVLLCLLTRPSWLVCLLTVSSVPAWAWGGAVLLVSIGSILSENFQIHVLVGYRLWIMQAIVLAGELFAIWLFQRGLLKLFSPFVAYSEGVAVLHKLFNAVVLWPEPDPLRKRKSREIATEDSSSKAARLSLRSTQIILVGSASLFAVAGVIGYYRMGAQLAAGATGWSEVLQPHMQPAVIERMVSHESLPVDFEGMKLVGFDMLSTPGTATSNSQTAVWTYAYQSQTVQLSLAVPLRGCYPQQRQWLADGAEVLESPQAIESKNSGDEPSVLLDELTIKEPLTGPSYLAYATWSPNGQLERAVEIGDDWTWRSLLASLVYQPNTASLSLFVAGHVPNAAESEDYQRILLNAARRLRGE